MYILDYKFVQLLVIFSTAWKSAYYLVFYAKVIVEVISTNWNSTYQLKIVKIKLYYFCGKS